MATTMTRQQRRNRSAEQRRRQQITRELRYERNHDRLKLLEKYWWIPAIEGGLVAYFVILLTQGEYFGAPLLLLGSMLFPAGVLTVALRNWRWWQRGAVVISLVAIGLIGAAVLANAMYTPA